MSHIDQLSPSPKTPDTYADHPIDQRLRAWAVRRSSGEIEKGWLEEGRGVKNGVEFARLIKQDAEGQVLTKNVPLESLNSLKEELDEEKLKQVRKDKLAGAVIGEASKPQDNPKPLSSEDNRFSHLFEERDDGLSDQERIQRAAVPMTPEQELIRQRRAADKHDAALKRVGRPEMQ